ncbi:hypothetical protein AB0M02_44165 [Actinoplanes sp. NPDC051861]|uniref:hypothetical protein n=1 Tax=Actinoplanes sp. NPDC051861 TaxID=3155170 RepID=UPI003446592E
MTRAGGARPASDRPATDLTVADEKLLFAAARILLRHYHPDWRPTDEQLDAFAHGYALGARDNLTQGRMNQVHLPPDCEWPTVAKPGGGE